MFHMVCFVVVWYRLSLPISVKVISLPLSYSYDYPSDIESIIKNMYEYITAIHQNKL